MFCIDEVLLNMNYNDIRVPRLDRNDAIGWLSNIAGFSNAYGGTMYIGVADKTNKLIGFS